MHVVQIWILHINALRTHLMHINIQTNPEKSQKVTQHSCCSMLTREKLESNKRQWISFRPQRWDVPSWNPHACCEKLLFVRSIYANLPHMGQKNYHDMLMLLHDSMPSFMNFRWVLDLLEFKNQASQCFAGNQWCPSVWNSWNLACYHGAASTCHGNFFVPFGAGLGISFSQAWWFR